MPKYQANPVIVDAFKIVSVGPVDALGARHVATDDGQNRIAGASMLSRMTPAAEDYWVIQSDGYEYLNPADVFQRKYSPLIESGVDTEILPDGTVIGKPLPDLRGIR
jgi:hypothetical protein